MASDSFGPLFSAYIAGYFVPSGTIKIEQTAYATADLIEATTYAWGGQDWGRISQKFMPCSFKVNAGPDPSSMTQLIDGILDQIDCAAHSDEIKLRGRGVLSLLIDKRVSIKPLQNVTVADAITQLITSVGLVPQVTPTPGLKVGAQFNDKNFGLNRNSRILDVIQSLAFGVGFRVRAQNRTVIVGPPPDKTQAYVMKRVWGGGESSGETMSISHSALHARNAKVIVHSYVQSTKQKATSSATTLSALAQSLGLPNPVASSKNTSKGTRGGNISTSSTPAETENPNTQEYVINAHNKSAAEIDLIKQGLELDIARREFRLNYTFSPTPTEFAALIQNSPEFLIDLSGCPMPSNNGVYHPEKITWNWSVGDDGNGGSAIGLTIDVTALNHDIPQPSGSLPNTTS